MNAPAATGATLQEAEIALIAAAYAGVDVQQRVLRAVESIAATRVATTVFSATTCILESMELERIYSTHRDVYPVAARKSKVGTGWAAHVLQGRRVFVGEGALEMAAAFDDQEQMARVGIRSIINVPIVVRDRCIAVLNFGRAVERVAPHEVLVARVLGLIATAAFLPA